MLNVRKIIDFFAGRKFLQPLYEWMFRAGVYGMNYGTGGNKFRNSGELFVADYICNQFKHSGTTLVLFDVGANLGKYAIHLSNAMKQLPFRMYAFEPSKIIFNELKKNTANESRIVPYNTGLGAMTEERILYKRSDLSGLSSVYQRRLEHFKIDMSIQESISITTVDEFCRLNDISHIHFLKLDIEGHEFFCLEGAAEMMKQKKIDFIQFEFGGCNIDSRTYFQDFWYLLKDQYNIYRIVRDGLVQIHQYNERLEIFKNINFLAELKK